MQGGTARHRILKQNTIRCFTLHVRTSLSESFSESLELSMFVQIIMT